MLNLQEFQALCMQVLAESEQFIADLKPVTHRAIQALDTSMLHVIGEAMGAKGEKTSTSYDTFARMLVDSEQADLMCMWVKSLAKTRSYKMGLQMVPDKEEK